jgi:hypothetical protein
LTECPESVREQFREVTTNYLIQNPKHGDEVLNIARQIARENSNSEALYLIACAFFHKSPDKAQEVAELMGLQLISRRAKIMTELIDIHDSLALPPPMIKNYPINERSCVIHKRPTNFKALTNQLHV